MNLEKSENLITLYNSSFCTNINLYSVLLTIMIIMNWSDQTIRLAFCMILLLRVEFSLAVQYACIVCACTAVR